jgi:hypothetical protein
MDTSPPATTIAQLDLDICTPEGRTWLARIDGIVPSERLDRKFMRYHGRITSRSGMTGTASYLVGDGLYESNEGRRRLGRRYWAVTQGEIREINFAELSELLSA